eukprot:179669-Pelagomonas_calceolata.AAC.1
MWFSAYKLLQQAFPHACPITQNTSLAGNGQKPAPEPLYLCSPSEAAERDYLPAGGVASAISGVFSECVPNPARTAAGNTAGRTAAAAEGKSGSIEPMDLD